MMNLNYLMDHILYQIFKIILNIYLKNFRERLKYYKRKLTESTKSKITKNENG